MVPNMEWKILVAICLLIQYSILNVHKIAAEMQQAIHVM